MYDPDDDNVLTAMLVSPDVLFPSTALVTRP